MALDKGFNKVYGYDYIGEDYKEIGNYASSEKTYQKMIAVFPNNYKGYTLLALLYYKIEIASPTLQKNFDKVNTYYQLALKRYNRSINDDQFGLLEDHIKELKTQGSIK